MDIRTLLICFLALLGSCTVALLLISVREPDARGLRWLAGAFACCTLGAALGAARGSIADVWSIVAGNTFVMIAFLLLHQAAVAVLGGGRRHLRVGATLLVGYVLGAAYYTFVVNDARPRIVYFSVLLAVSAGLSSLVLLRAEGETGERTAMRSVGVLFGALAASNLLRALLTLRADAPVDFMRGDLVQSASLLGLLVITVLIGFGFFWMTSARLSAALREQAIRDELTGLLNRRGFMRRAGELRRAAARDHRLLLLIFADLDGLKQINDTAGHQAGDRLLREGAEILREALPPSGALARLSGDEFAALLAVESPGDAEVYLGRIARRAEARNATSGGSAAIGISAAGILVEPDESDSVETLLQAVDGRMYVAKRARKGPPPPARATDIRLPAGSLKRIHVDRRIVGRYDEGGPDEPAWIVRTPDGAYHCRSWSLTGGIEGVQSLAKPITGGHARLWLESREEIELFQATLLPPRDAKRDREG